MSDADQTARFTALAHDVATPLRRYLVRRVSAAAVDDVVAEVLLVLWRRLADVPPDDPLPWTYAVARGCVANARRAEQRHLRLVDRLGRLERRPALLAPEGQSDADAEVHAALAGLREVDREVVTLWAWEGLAPREIATVTGLTPNAVSIRLHRAKKALARELGKNAPLGGQVPDEGRRPR
ncbi:RNA polymerase sigma factor [Intrasporangium oryzae]|nr:sigma-70 family RNA polymerase sigma factor [Intrasporangium oryzae]